MYCEDGNFRPIDLQFGPDGALYIVDWHNALIGHLQHNLREPHRDHSHGRIWRVTYAARPLLKPARIAGAPVPALLDLLKSPEDRTRYRVRRELGRAGFGQSPAPPSLSGSSDWMTTSSESITCSKRSGCTRPTINVALELLDKLLQSEDHRVRAAATRALSYWLDRIDNPLDRLRKLVVDKHPRVRLEAVRALSYLQGDDAIETALEVLNFDTDQ